MAKIMVTGPMADVELTIEDDGSVLALCVEHSHSDGTLAPPGDCGWSSTFADISDATHGATIENHADRGTR